MMDDDNDDNDNSFTAIITVNLYWLAPLVKNWRIFFGEKLYCPHALDDGNQQELNVHIREKPE